MKEIPKKQLVVAYCRGPYCVFADQAVEVLRKAGYRAFRLESGFPDWEAKGLPVERDAVRTITIVRERDALEWTRVARRQRDSECPQQLGHRPFARRTRDETRHVHLSLVHQPPMGLPRRETPQVRKHALMPFQP